MYKPGITAPISQSIAKCVPEHMLMNLNVHICILTRSAEYTIKLLAG